LKNLTVPVMAIGKVLPRTAPPLRAIRVSADRTFAAGSLATWADRVHARPAWIFYSALITPPQPFAEAERKASPNGLSI